MSPRHARTLVASLLLATPLATPLAAQQQRRAPAPKPPTPPAKRAAPAHAPLELDHVLLLVPPGAEAAVARLRAAGFNVANDAQRHVGQGTASIPVLLENAYLELLWIDTTVRRDAGNALDIERLRRVPNASRVGIGLRRVGVPPMPKPTTDAQGLAVRIPPQPLVPLGAVSARRYSAPWMPPGTAIQLVRQPAESLAAELFVVQDEVAQPWWIGQVRHEATILLQHPGGWRRVRRVVVHGPTAQLPAALARLEPARIEWRSDASAAAAWVEMELEGGAPGRTVDLRPTLPLVLRR